MIKLYDYWRSSSCYRVRIALGLKSLGFLSVPIDLTSKEQTSDAHLARHPQGLVPAIEVDGELLTQSLAIIDYIDGLTPHENLLPLNPKARAHVLSLSHIIAMDIHPICNLKVLNHLATLVDGAPKDVKTAWNKEFISTGLCAFEQSLSKNPIGKFCYGDTPSMADCCLIPQLYNAKRWGVDYSSHKHICRIENTCLEVEAFTLAHPDNYRADN